MQPFVCIGGGASIKECPSPALTCGVKLTSTDKGGPRHIAVSLCSSFEMRRAGALLWMRVPGPMEKFTSLTGVAAPLEITNVDTDMIIPKQYLKTIKRTGLGQGLFAEMRYHEDGTENPDFVLNKPAYRNAKILVAQDNFGCGSSAVSMRPGRLLDFGIRCVISTSFADIFYNNCFKNGILPIVVSPEDLAKLMDDAKRGSNATLSIDLEAQESAAPTAA